MASVRQPDLFAHREQASFHPRGAPPPAPELSAPLLIDWQRRVTAHQSGVHRDTTAGGQLSLMKSCREPSQETDRLDPFRLTPQSLEFWRWPHAPHEGAAIYFVVDRPPHLEDPLLLYVGETGRADRRWKGEHDCKSYLAAYGEALRRVALGTRLSIRFWCDVPVAVAGRRALEQALIRRWLPPFNRETRERWTTPFTADPL